MKKHRYGEYKNVLLSDEEKQKLKDKFGEKKAFALVVNMDEAVEMKGYKYKSHYLAILKWERNNKNFNFADTKTSSAFASKEMDARLIAQKQKEKEQEQRILEANAKNNPRLAKLLSEKNNLLKKV